MQLNWILLTFLSILFMTIGISISKKLLFKLDPLQILFYQYIASIVSVFIQGTIREGWIFFDIENCWLISLGFLFGLGVFATNKAFQINLSRSVIVNQFTSVVAVIFSMIFLREYLLFDPRTMSGLLMIFAVPLAIFSVFLMKGFGRGEIGKRWLIWCITFVLILGFATFLVKVFVTNKSFLEVLFFQYIGSFIIVSLGELFAKKNLSLGKSDILQASLVGIFLSFSLSCLYQAFSIAPLAYVNTLQTVGFTITGVISGLLVFREKETLNLKSVIGMLVGFGAVILIVISNLVQ